MSNNAIVRGSFVADGTRRRIAIPCDIDYMLVVNETVAQTDGPDVMNFPELAVRSEYMAEMPQGRAYVISKVSTTNELVMDPCLVGGFTLIDDANPGSNAALALDNPTFTQADPAVWDVNGAHGFLAGDIVRVYNITGADQYSGLDLTVTSVAAGTDKFQTLLDTQGVTQGTAGSVRRLNADVSLYYPRRRYIAVVDQGTTTDIRLTVAHDFKVDEYVRFLIPSIFGMVELNGLRGKVLAVDDTITVNTITVDIDSSAFTAFAFPDDGNLPFTFAQVIPDAEFPGIISAATRNVGIKGIELGSVVGGNEDDVIRWIACQVDQAEPFYKS